MAILTKTIIEYVSADLTAAKAIDTTGRSDGMIMQIATMGIFRLAYASTATPDDRDVIQPTVGPGRWIRQTLLELLTTVSGKIDSSQLSLIPIANGGTNSATALNNSRIMVSSGGGIVEASALTNGQILIGSTGTAPVAASITGTANRVTVTGGAGTITLSGPQDLAAASSPTFAMVTVSNAPSAATDACNKTYVDALVDGRLWGAACRVCSTTAGTLATDFDNGKTVDSVVIATGNRIILTAQADAKENGVYKVNASGAPTRDETETSLANHSFWVKEGTANGNKGWFCTNDTITYGVTSIAFVLVGSGVYTASTNMVLTGNAFSTSLTPTFQNATLSNTTNQIVLGTTNTVTITSLAPAASRVFTINDPLGDANLVPNYTGATGAGDPTKRVKFDSSGATTGKLLTLASSHTDNRTITFPDVTDTVSVLGLAQTNTALKTFSAGVQFATSGGTAATLNHYELNYAHATTVSGIWAAAQNITLYLSRIGSMVWVRYAGAVATATTATTIALDAVLPARFRPSAGIVIPIITDDNGIYKHGGCYIDTAGNMTWGTLYYNTAFSGTGTSGLAAISFSYSL